MTIPSNLNRIGDVEKIFYTEAFRMFEKIAQMLAEQLSIPVDSITLESRIIEDLGADSLDVVELMMSLEDNLGKTIPDDKMAELKTVGDVVKLVEEI